MTTEAWNAGKLPDGARVVVVANTSALRCAVRGMLRPGAMCGSVIVGMEFCGFKGECPRQRPSISPTPPAESKQGAA